MEQVQFVVKAGLKWVQVRIKNRTESTSNEILEITKICKENNVTCIINDYYDLVIPLKGNGVHCGLKDQHPIVLYNLLGKNRIIGTTVNSVNDAKNVSEYQKSHYVGVGPYKQTTTKENLAEILTSANHQEILNTLSIPAIAIGGIQPEDIKEILNLGYHGIAVSSGVFCANDPIQAINNYQNTLESQV
jgi:thiamine-phosphate pyrophosphorylase